MIILLCYALMFQRFCLYRGCNILFISCRYRFIMVYRCWKRLITLGQQGGIFPRKLLLPSTSFASVLYFIYMSFPLLLNTL